MKNNSIELSSSVYKHHQQNAIGFASFPTVQQIQDYQQLAHKLRSTAFVEFWKSISGYAAAKWSKMKKSWRQRKAMAELDKLSPFILKDIGVTRADIEQLRNGSMTVESFNNHGVNGLSDRFTINKKVDLQLCQCVQNVDETSLAENSMLAKCG